jgi:uncharacterized protein
MASPLAAKDVPFLSGRVVDLAEILSPASEERIEARLAALEESKGAQVAVLTIASLEGESLEEYSLRVAETWKLGRGEFDDGALLLIARDDRRMRLEVGYGLEPVLTDALSGRVLDQVLRPSFRAGDFDGGVESAVDAIVRLTEGESNVLPPPEDSRGEDLPARERFFSLAIFAIVIGTFSLSALGSSGCMAWFMYLFLMPFWFLFPRVLLGPTIGMVLFLGWVIGFPVLRLLVGRSGGGDGGGGFFGGGRSWTWSTGTGGWSGGGGGGCSGGFSGGGGSFGGGGASGGW